MSARAQTVPPAALSTARKAALGVEVLLTYLRVRRLLRRSTLPETLAALRTPSTVQARAGEDEFRLARAVRRTLVWLPTDTRCLTQSLVLVSLLARRALAGTLVIGVGSSTDFKAHAWIEAGGRPLLPPLEHEYRRLTEL